jgi:hypothetical protein
MDKDSIHDPDEEQQQDSGQDDEVRRFRIGPGGDLEPIEPEQPSDNPTGRPMQPARGSKPRKPQISWRPHDRGFDTD